MPTLPVIDISALHAMQSEAGVAQVAAGLDAACREYGFFYAEGHGIDDALFDRLEAASHRFFALPEEAKSEIAMAKAGTAWRGWFPLGGELTSGLPDRKEGLYLGEELGPDDPRVRDGWPLHGANLWPGGVPELRAAAEAYLAAAVTAAEALMRGLAVALGLPPGHFADRLTRRPTLLFRIFHYPPADPSPEWQRSFGVGEHSDYGLLTLLGQDAQGGLAVRTRDGWIDVPPRGHALVVNIGDMFERLTLGRYRSAPHRVVNRSGRARLSYPLFFDPDFAASVEPLPIAGETVRGEARWDGVDLHAPIGSYGEYLIGKVGKVFPELAAREAISFA